MGVAPAEGGTLSAGEGTLLESAVRARLIAARSGPAQPRPGPDLHLLGRGGGGRERHLLAAPTVRLNRP